MAEVTKKCEEQEKVLLGRNLLLMDKGDTLMKQARFGYCLGSVEQRAKHAKGEAELVFRESY